jgi:transcriptional regulator with XRE-family HTH domain
MPWDASDARNGGNPLSGYLAPVGYGAKLDAQPTRDLSPQATIGGVTQQLHTGQRSHSVTLSEAKPPGNPFAIATAHNLFRATEPASWHILGMGIGERIRAARLQLGYTQRHVARELNVNPSAVNQWESGTTKPSITKRAELAFLLKLPIDQLIPEAPPDEIANAISRIVRGLPPHKQIALVAAIEGLARLLDDPPPSNPIPPAAKTKQYS